MNCVPIVMVRNEENYIANVLRPLAKVFPVVLVGDTGSTDRTVEIASQIDGVSLIQFGARSPKELGRTRKDLQDAGRSLGFDWAFLVDGDELYHPDALMGVAASVVPQGRRTGFTSMVSVDQAEDGTLWELKDRFSRNAIFPITDGWVGEYPFESPESWNLGSDGFFYLETPPGLEQHALHLHRLRRSSQDHVVYRRDEKRFQFAMVTVEVPRTHPLEDVWLTLLS